MADTPRGMFDATVELPPTPASRPSAPATPVAREPTPFEHGPDRFETRGELGRGGMGRVDDAFDRALGRPVAIKHLLRGGELDRARFEREARITARLEHPGIVPLHEAGLSPDGTPYYVMRRVDGRPLSELIAAPLAERLALIPNVLTACDALAFAHARGIVHRDIKPTNILVGRYGETLVIDWGLAREIDMNAALSGTTLPISDDALTAVGTVAGTPGFMAPEQARGEVVDARADVFALGATLFFVITSKSPYSNAAATEMVRRASAGAAPDWDTMPAGVPDDLRAIVGKALAGDPAARYQDAGELAADLRRFVTGNLVGAHHYSTATRLARFVRRHRAVVAVATASVIVLAIVGTLALRRVIAERDDATAARALAERRQREATDVADQMLVEQARTLATTDPIGAIALLRRLDPSSPRWRDAWLAAVSARLRGIPIGFQAQPSVLWLELASDGSRAVTTTSTGDIEVFDLAARTHHRVTTLDRASSCHWLAAARLACVYEYDRLAIVDSDTGATRTIDGVHASATYGDHASRALVESSDGSIVELHADGGLQPFATHARIAAATPDLREVVLWRDASLELVAPGAKPRAFGAFTDRRVPSAEVEIQGDLIARRLGDEVTRWRVTPDRVVELGHANEPGLLMVVIGLGHVFGVTPIGLRTLDVGPGVTFEPPHVHPGTMFTTASGFGAIENTSLAVVGDDGLVHLGPFSAQLTRVDVSFDGRVVVAMTTLDELLAWNLDASRPRTIAIDNTEEPLAMTPTGLWSFVLTEGLVRRELAHLDGAAVPAIRAAVAPVPAPWITVADDGTWAAMRDPMADTLVAYDTARGTAGVLAGAIDGIADGDGDGLVIASADRTIARWRPGATASVPIGKLPEPSHEFSVTAGFALEDIGGRREIRVELPGTIRGEAKFDADVRDAAVTRDGRAWIVGDGGQLWRWELSADPVRVEVGHPIANLARLGGHWLAHAPRALYVLDGDPAAPPREIAVDMVRGVSLDAGYIAVVSSTGAVSIVDLEAGLALAIPNVATEDHIALGHGSTVVIQLDTGPDNKRLQAYDLAVPHDPEALRRWLADVTNARGTRWP